MTFQPAYYQGRRVHVFHASSHPCTYVYLFVRQGRYNALGTFYPKPRTRLAKAEAYWSDTIRKRPRFN